MKTPTSRQNKKKNPKKMKQNEQATREQKTASKYRKPKVDKNHAYAQSLIDTKHKTISNEYTRFVKRNLNRGRTRH